MAHNVTSSVVSDQDATPIAKVNVLKKGGSSRKAYGSLTVVATTAAQTMCFVRVPVRARIADVLATNLTNMGDGSVKIGVFRPNGGIAISDAVISAAVNLGTSRTTPTSVLTAPSVANRAKSIADWLATEIGTAGATSDVEVDIVASVVTVSTGTAVAVGLEVDYVLPE
jgi:hypothetical protein